MDYLTELFCLVDDFCKTFEPKFNQQRISHQANKKIRQRKASVSTAEIMTVWIYFHQIRYRHFKTYYLFQIKRMLSQAFPNMPSYNRFVELAQRTIIPFSAFLKTQMGQCSGISFVDSTALAVCHNRRIPTHRVFAGSARRGKSSMGWFYGFKLHALINHQGALVDVRLTPGNVNDRHAWKDMAASLWSIVVGDKGYLGKELTQWLQNEYGIRLVTGKKKNMKQKDKIPFEPGFLQKRGVIESVFDELKNLCQIEHTRHRSYTGFLLNLISGLVAYCLMPFKPGVKISAAGLPARG
ncbi:IS982 family transposase [Uruburuella testudinis]|uniref:IS982 family transposase n=1 Tax=Uruburuella testudinis TaxID=1282863 RepID=A0ABY4DX29_9NEIS|nr:IS982 family transposase [Uruburuella testudinis]UOO81246.1 IS982 family transposase [Uruburuella testudinis]